MADARLAVAAVRAQLQQEAQARHAALARLVELEAEVDATEADAEEQVRDAHRLAAEAEEIANAQGKKAARLTTKLRRTRKERDTELALRQQAEEENAVRREAMQCMDDELHRRR